MAVTNDLVCKTSEFLLLKSAMHQVTTKTYRVKTAYKLIIRESVLIVISYFITLMAKASQTMSEQ